MRKGGLGGLGKMSSRSFGGSRKSFGGSFGPRLGSSSRRIHSRPRSHHHRHYGGWYGRGYYGRRRYYGRRGNPIVFLIILVFIFWIINPWIGLFITVIAVVIILNQDKNRKVNSYNSAFYNQQPHFNPNYPTTATQAAPTTQPQRKFVQRPKAKFCKVCGEAVLVESAFCSECGTKV